MRFGRHWLDDWPPALAFGAGLHYHDGWANSRGQASEKFDVEDLTTGLNDSCAKFEAKANTLWPSSNMSDGVSLSFQREVGCTYCG